MPPDFEQIAKTLTMVLTGNRADQHDVDLVRKALVDAWNARGAEDIAKAEHELIETMGASSCAPYVKKIARGLRTLDR